MALQHLEAEGLGVARLSNQCKHLILEDFLLSKNYLQLRFDFMLENRPRLLLGRHIADLNKARLVLLGCGQRRKESGLGVRGPMANSISADEERLLNRCKIMLLRLVQLVLI